MYRDDELKWSTENWEGDTVTVVEVIATGEKGFGDDAREAYESLRRRQMRGE